MLGGHMGLLRINHIILGTLDIESTAKFYSTLFGYKQVSPFVDIGTGNTGVVLSHEDGPELLLVPFSKERLPNPQHIAFEVDEEFFGEILANCASHKIQIRSLPNLDASPGEPVRHEELGKSFKHFYFCDPNRVNLEIMTRAF
ncbi:MAG: VOC family protein [Bacteriovoracia bacterium]